MLCAEQAAGVKGAVAFSLGKADSFRRPFSVPEKKISFHIFGNCLMEAPYTHTQKRQSAGSGVRTGFSSFACGQEVIFQEMQPALVPLFSESDLGESITYAI